MLHRGTQLVDFGFPCMGFSSIGYACALNFTLASNTPKNLDRTALLRGFFLPTHLSFCQCQFHRFSSHMANLRKCSGPFRKLIMIISARCERHLSISKVRSGKKLHLELEQSPFFSLKVQQLKAVRRVHQGDHEHPISILRLVYACIIFLPFGHLVASGDWATASTWKQLQHAKNLRTFP